MQRCSGSTSSNDRRIRRVLGTMGDATLTESRLKFRLGLGSLYAPHDGFVAKARDVVGLADHGNLIFIFDNAAGFNGRLGRLGIASFEYRQANGVGHLVVYGEHSSIRLGSGKFGQCSIDLGGVANLVDIKLLQAVLQSGGYARPNDLLIDNWRDEEDGLVRTDVVDEVAVSHVTACEVEKEPMLTMKDQYSSLACINLEDLPEVLWEVIVYLKLRLARLEIEDTVGVYAIITKTLDSTLSVAFGGIFALEGVLEVFGSHYPRIERYKVVRSFLVKAGGESQPPRRSRMRVGDGLNDSGCEVDLTTVTLGVVE